MTDAPPIATATIARLYMLQGKLEQAERLYQKLLEESPEDERLERGLTEVRQRRQARLEPFPGDDRLELVWQGERLRCRYTITAEGQRRAGLLLGAGGALVLRLHAYPALAGAASLDHPLPQPSGELEVAVPAQARVLAAAVGLSAPGDRFVAIAHFCTAAA